MGAGQPAAAGPAGEPACEFYPLGEDIAVRDGTIIGRSAWWADHLTAWAQRFVKSGTAPLMANGLTRDETAATASVAGLAEPQKRPAWLDDPGPPTAEQLEAYRRASAAPQAAPVPAPSDDGEHPAARRIRESFEQKYKDLAGVMRTILAWRHAWAEYQRPYNRDMQEPVTEDQVDQAERGMLTAIRGYAAARTSSTAAAAPQAQVRALTDAQKDQVLADVVGLLSRQHEWLTRVAAINLVAGLYGRAGAVLAAPSQQGE